MEKKNKIAPVTTILVILISLIYLAEFYMTQNHTTDGLLLIDFGAKYGPLVIQHGEYWRLVTAIFLHVSWMHVITNMVTLWFIGALAESYFGTWRYLLLFFIGGIGGNVASCLFAPDVVAVGSSTAIFAIFGGLLVYTMAFSNQQGVMAQGQILAAFVILNLVVSFTSQDVDLWGHLGGLLTGTLLAIVIGFKGKQGRIDWPMRIIAGSLILLALLISVWKLMG
ncbi:rhomboid family intramembrane serine protease [Eupransor demetentiae]|uniref:Rhomboid family (GlpG) n=1 Tax=Eupransor demetentiae TaxID=3109584 RepID=A0ABM9N3C9_9LACO|nr:Membrane-associated serine protease [Lactobacillaceae bacterium LMG 33000]